MTDEKLSPEAAALIAKVRAERTLTPEERERSYARIGLGIGVTTSGIFAARNAAGAGTSTAAHGAGQSALVLGKWWVLGGLLVTAGVAGIGAYAGSRSSASQQAAPAAQVRGGAQRGPDAPDQARAQGEKAAPSLAPEPASRPAEAAPKTEESHGSGATAAGSAPRASSRPTTSAATTTAEEVMLLHQARAVLRSNPAQALSLASRHEQRYPRSQLAAERQVVTILALCDLGRVREARRRSAALASRSPALSALEGSCAERR